MPKHEELRPSRLPAKMLATAIKAEMSQVEKKLEEIQKLLDRLQGAVTDLKHECAKSSIAREIDQPPSLAPLIKQLQRAFDAQPSAPIPLAHALWDTATIATYLNRSDAAVRERVTPLPDFPKAIRLPSKQGVGSPLYKAIEVITWAEKYREKR